MLNQNISIKEQRIRKITQLYYSKEEIQKIMFDFSNNREVVPRYFEGFGKRPDAFQYPSDIFELVKRGATSFHCSQEIWKDPLQIQTGMNEKQLNELRKGWDLLIDIDSKYIDYSKIMAEEIIKLLEFHSIKNFGIKFSGSKGFHIIVPWKSFPKEVNNIKLSDKFPDYPRIITKYIIEKTKNRLIERVSELERPNKYIKDFQAPKEVMPDLVLVSPRHLFRMPYSLHEKTALASIVLDKNQIKDFDLKDAEPMIAKIKEFYPKVEKEEASELLMQALDWNSEKEINEDNFKKIKESSSNFKQIKIEKLSVSNFPYCIQKILQGISDGKKRALFILINFFRSIGVEKEELERKIQEWNEKNEIPLKKGYIKAQLDWSFKRKQFLPPNCKEYYQGIGVCVPDELCSRIKNPVNYAIKKSFIKDNTKRKKNKTFNKEKNK